MNADERGFALPRSSAFIRAYLRPAFFVAYKEQRTFALRMEPIHRIKRGNKSRVRRVLNVGRNTCDPRRGSFRWLACVGYRVSFWCSHVS